MEINRYLLTSENEGLISASYEASIREQIQERLAQVVGVDCGVAIPDGMVEVGKTYFGYELQSEYRGSDFNKNYTYRLYITGRLVRKESGNENTLDIMDSATLGIVNALKSMNFKVSWNDISFQDGIRKTLIKGYVFYNEINNTFII